MDELPEELAPPRARVPEDMVRNGRLYGGILVFAALGLAAFEYLSIPQPGRLGVISLFVVSFCAVAGVAALIEPGLVWSLSPRRSELPRSLRTAGVVLALVLAGLSVGLVWYVKGGRLF